MERRAQREAAVLSAQVALADADERAWRSPLRHVGSGRGRRALRRGELQARLRWRGHAVDRRARDAGHRLSLPALEARRAAAARRRERVTQAPAGWDDAAVRSPGGHVLQSAAWAGIREAQGWRAEFLEFGEPLPVALVLWRSLPAGRSIAYVPRGPIIGDASQLEAAVAKLASIARERNAIFLKVDPEIGADVAAGPLRAAGFRRAPDIQPVLAPLELDLRPAEDALVPAPEKDTRRSVRPAGNPGGPKREARARRFDFGGIPVDVTRKDDPMYGPYHFKEGFGGVPRQFVGAHDSVPNELAYRVYAVAEPAYTTALRVLGRIRR